MMKKQILMSILVVLSIQLFGQSKDSLSIYTAKANEFMMKGLYEKALSACNSALRIDSNNCKFLKIKGNILSSLGKQDEAIALYKKSINKNCNVVFNCLTLKSIYYDEGKTTDALTYLNKVITLKPDSGALYYERWSIKTKMKDTNGANEDLQKAIKLGCQSAKEMDKQMKKKEKEPTEVEEKE
jgi:tetratricopeptide (TPR) repeat protein